jgi:hypothetical protein
MRVRVPATLPLGRTHASSVSAPGVFSFGDPGTVMVELVPLKVNAPPNFPPAIQDAFETVPVLPFPELSGADVPDVLNEYAATTPVGALPAPCAAPTPRIVAASTNNGNALTDIELPPRQLGPGEPGHS